MYTDIQLREIFHFCFLNRLLKTTDIELFVLKGGVNLRFFFQSPRYSEDMDLDVLGGSVATLKKNGYKILNDASFQRSLKVFDIDSVEINDPHKAKHTKTTQRFRCSLVRSSGQQLPTKVEFSRRADEVRELTITEQVDPGIALPYRKLAYPCRHYNGTAAVAQKIEALAGRSVAQARDVFDLGILQAGGHLASAADQDNFQDLPFAAAIDALLSLHWEDYEGQVLEYLAPEILGEFGSRDAWVNLQNEIYEVLLAHA